MRILEIKKNSHLKVVKLFGKVIFFSTFSYKKDIQKYFGKFITTQRTIDENYNVLKTTKILNIEVFKKEIDKVSRKTYILGKLVFTSSADFRIRFIKKYKKYFKGYKHVFILQANSGEVYLFLTYVMDAFLKKNNITKDILIICTKKYHMDLINMICPNIPHILVNEIKALFDNHLIIGEYNFYTLFPDQYFIKVEKDIKNNPLDTIHYFDSILKVFNIDKNELSYKQVQITQKLKDNVLKKTKKIALNLDKFVIVAPEANSCENCDNEFWNSLCENLQKNGYDVFLNTVEVSEINRSLYKTCNLSFSEIFALATMSKGIVSLRSGLTECLLQAHVPIFCLYTNFKDRDIFNDMKVEYVLSGFGLSKLPNVNKEKIYEYNMNKFNNDDLIKNIIMQIQEAN